MEKEIRWSEHAAFKLEILKQRGVNVPAELAIATVRSPERLEESDDKYIAQRSLNETLVLRVVYREFNAFILIITLYPGKKSRYEKDSLQ